MLYRLLADLVLMIHLAFILFVILGGLLTAWRRWILFAHVPAAIWGAVIELAGWICPLTHLENDFRLKAGQSGYTRSFIEHHLLPVIYPDGLARDTQVTLGIAVVLINVAIYAGVFICRRVGHRTNA